MSSCFDDGRECSQDCFVKGKCNAATIPILDETVTELNRLADNLREALYPIGRPAHMTSEDWEEIGGE